MDKFQFNQRVKHGRLDFSPKLIYGFEDPDAAPYFKACKWGDKVKASEDVDIVITIDELDIDPLTVFGDPTLGTPGMFVMPERAAAFLREQGHDVTDEWAAGYKATFVPINAGDFADHVAAELKASEGSA